MAEYIPKIQESLRLNGYPLAKTAVVHEGLFTSTGVSTVQRQQWHLRSRDSTRSIVLTDSFVAVQTTAYTVFEDFVKELKLAVDTIASEVKGLIVQRVGLRYVDLVRPKAGQTWQEYLVQELHGIRSRTFTEDSQTQLHQSVARTAQGTMIVRLFQNRDGLVLPPDLSDQDVKPNIKKPPESRELLTILDLDHYSELDFEYEQGRVEREVWQLHDALDHVFRESLVTDKALKEWA